MADIPDLTDTETWTVDDLRALEIAARTEAERRDRVATLPGTIAAHVGLYQQAAGLYQTSGAAWVAPTGYHDAYPRSAEVTHADKTWIALRDGASGEPGVVTGDWQEKQVEGEYAEWVRPHAGAEYPPGTLVTHNGRYWRNDHTAGNGWEPGTNGSQWADLGPINE